ncbi:hypothetical protein LEP1GSC165_2433 [Leptospira santarosai str. CBC523]|nr:hypothetical protein LEP1GSC165_2433 [Leptospira santarosai str. CBC523]
MYFSDIVNNKIIVFLKMNRKFGVVCRFFIFLRVGIGKLLL